MKKIEDLTIGQLRELVEPLSSQGQARAMSSIAVHGNSLSELMYAIGQNDAKFIRQRLKEILEAP